MFNTAHTVLPSLSFKIFPPYCSYIHLYLKSSHPTVVIYLYCIFIIYTFPAFSPRVSSVHIKNAEFSDVTALTVPCLAVPPHPQNHAGGGGRGRGICLMCLNAEVGITTLKLKGNVSHEIFDLNFLRFCTIFSCCYRVNM